MAQMNLENGKGFNIKNFSLQSILCFLFITFSILLSAASDETNVCSPTMRRANEYSASQDIEDFKKAHNLATKESTNSKFSRARPLNLLVFASQSPEHARVVILTTRFLGEVTRGKKWASPSNIQLLAGFARIPCNKSRANKALKEDYDKDKIPLAEQKPFTDIDESGCWKRLPLPGHLTLQILPEEIRNYTLPTDLDIGPLPDRSSPPTKHETTESKSCCCIQ